MSNNLISIILPTYNGEKYLPQLMESLIHQTYTNLEIVVVDDCSIDNTVPIVERYASFDERIKLAINEQNLGININFERGIGKANGVYIFLCDQDDCWEINKVELMVKCLDNDYDLVFCDLRVIDGNNKVISPSFHKLIGTSKVNANNMGGYLLLRNITNGCSTAFRKEILNDILPFPDYMIYDWWIMLITAQKYKMTRIIEPLMSYRIHDNNAIGFSTISKSRQVIIKELQDSINRLNKLQEILNTNITHSAEITSRYYRCRMRFLNNEVDFIEYLAESMKYLTKFPAWYKNIVKNIIDDCFPAASRLLMYGWKRVNMKTL